MSLPPHPSKHTYTISRRHDDSGDVQRIILNLMITFQNSGHLWWWWLAWCCSCSTFFGDRTTDPPGDDVGHRERSFCFVAGLLRRRHLRTVLRGPPQRSFYNHTLNGLVLVRNVGPTTIELECLIMASRLSSCFIDLFTSASSRESTIGPSIAA